MASAQEKRIRELEAQLEAARSATVEATPSTVVVTSAPDNASIEAKLAAMGVATGKAESRAAKQSKRNAGEMDGPIDCVHGFKVARYFVIETTPGHKRLGQVVPRYRGCQHNGSDNNIWCAKRAFEESAS